MLIGYQVVSMHFYCNAPPVIPASDQNELGEGAATFNCDAPFGVFFRMFVWPVGPLFAIAIGAWTFRLWRNRRSAVT